MLFQTSAHRAAKEIKKLLDAALLRERMAVMIHPSQTTVLCLHMQPQQSKSIRKLFSANQQNDNQHMMKMKLSVRSIRSIRLACFFASVVFAMTGSVTSAGVLITFDDLGLAPLGDVTTQYAAQGVTFQGFTDAGSLTNIEVAGSSVFSDVNPPSLPYSLSNFYNHDKNQRARIMRIRFATPASNIGFVYDGAGPSGSSTTFKVYSPAGVLLNTFQVASATDSAFHPVNVPNVNVGYLDIVSPSAGWGHYIDNLQFESCSCGGSITFDTLGLPPLGDVTTQYAPQGAVFQGFTDAGAPANIEVADNTVFSDVNPPSLPYSLSNFYNHDKNQRTRIMRIRFTSPASGIGLMYDGAGASGANTTFNVYSPAGVLLNSFHVASATDSVFHPVNVPDVNVGYLDIVSPSAGWGHYIDNLQFSCSGPPSLSIQLAAAISWPSVLNSIYQVQWAPRVNSNAWFNLGPPLTGNGACLEVCDTVGPGSRFYRVVLNPTALESSSQPPVVSPGDSTNGKTSSEASSQPAIVPPAHSTARVTEKTNGAD
jgi:hypothetical protein